MLFLHQVSRFLFVVTFPNTSKLSGCVNLVPDSKYIDIYCLLRSRDEVSCRSQSPCLVQHDNHNLQSAAINYMPISSIRPCPGKHNDMTKSIPLSYADSDAFIYPLKWHAHTHTHSLTNAHLISLKVIFNFNQPIRRHVLLILSSYISAPADSLVLLHRHRLCNMVLTCQGVHFWLPPFP